MPSSLAKRNWWWGSFQAISQTGCEGGPDVMLNVTVEKLNGVLAVSERFRSAEGPVTMEGVKGTTTGAPFWGACEISTPRPPIRSTPWRAMPAFADARNVTVPFPVPDDPLWMVSQESLAEAVQEQDAGALTCTVPVPPVPTTVALDELSVKQALLRLIVTFKA